MNEVKMNKSAMRELSSDFDEEKLFEDEAVVQIITDTLMTCSREHLADTYEYLNKWTLPIWLKETLGMPDTVYDGWSDMTRSAKNRIIEPLMEIVKPIIIKRFVKENRTTFGIELDPWDSWRKGE